MDLLGGQDRTARRQAAAIKADLAEKLFNRGFTEGFMFGQGPLAQKTDASHCVSEWEFCGQVVQNYKKAVATIDGLIYVRVHNTIRSGEEVEIVCPGYDIIKIIMPKMVDAETGEVIEEAHGGRGQLVVVDAGRSVPEFSVFRRKII
jgi:hypothetical protein